ncbi:hypothetical protein H4R99_000811 [Coemansia sp. RSA 1722]|nr:hypothetical protein IWW45_001769 [Coemansia sp. RSA 485]KAJ2605807.1 hypothetical protein H4R99_000811 [Coemansia sp. RSA 1722]KAJ2638303.1 hypothetical protein GGF40_001754 [Coemansia sp. RSA 1286]
MGLFRKSKKGKDKRADAGGAVEMSGPQYGSRRGAEGGSRPVLGQPATAAASSDSPDADGHFGSNPGIHPVSAVDGGTTIDQVAQSVIDGFVFNVPYLRLNTSILVACHSEEAMASNLFSEEASVVYSDACYHDVQDPSARDSLDPHVFELVADAYAHVRRLRQDQAIVLSGVSGSGKSETAKLICDQLCVLASNSGRHNTKAQYQMAYVGAVVEAFSSAQTIGSRGATRVGMWQEIQFTDRGRVAGTKLVPFGLDRWRVTDVVPGEGNFNVFFYLLHGSTSAERQQLQLRHGDAAAFAYLTPQTQRAKDKNASMDMAPGHCAQMMDQLRTSLRVCGIKSRKQQQILQVLAAILHLGNVQFADAPDRSEDAAGVRNQEEVDLCAQFLGVTPSALTAALAYKTALVGGDLCTVFLNSHGAQAQRDALARALYHVLYYWLVDQLNRNIGDPEATNHIAVLQMYGFALPELGGFEHFAINLANERLAGFVLHEVLGTDTGVARLMHDDAVSLPHVSMWSQRLQTMHLMVGDYAGRRGGLVGALETHAAGDPAQATDDVALINLVNRAHGQHPCFVPGAPPGARQKPLFGIRHWMADRALEYSVDGFCQRNMDLEVSPDFYALLHGASHSRFVRELFSIDQVALDYHPGEESTIVGTFLSTRPSMRPTVRKPLAEMPDSDDGNARVAVVPLAVQQLQLPSQLRALDDADPANTFIGELGAALDDVLAAASYCKIWHILHVRSDHPARPAQPGQLDRAFVQQQVHALGLADMAARRTPTEFTVAMSSDVFVARYASVVDMAGDDIASVLVDRVAQAQHWVRGQHYDTGHRHVFMTERVWRSIDVPLRLFEKQRALARRHRGRGGNDAGMLDALAQVDDNGDLVHPHAMFNFDNDDAASTAYGSEAESSAGFDPEANGFFAEHSDDDALDNADYRSSRYVDSDCGESGRLSVESGHEKQHNWQHGNFDGDYGRLQQQQQQQQQAAREGLVEELDITPARRCWSRTTNTLTWLIPDWLIRCCGMKREDIRMAWREKVAICLIIVATWGFVLFFIIGLGLLMCPKQYVYNMDEVSDHTERSDAYVALRGRVYDITNFINQEHGKSRGGASPEDMIMYSGQEVNASFPLALRAACPDLVPARDDPNWLMYLKSDIETETSFPFVHRAGSLANSKEMMRQDFYHRHVLPKMRLFKVGDVVWDPKWIHSMHHRGGQYWRVINGEVFNLNSYFATRDAPENADQKKWRFLHRLVESIFEDAGARDTDITKYWRMLPISRSVRAANYRCLKTLFYVGRVDTRHSFRCLFPNFLLLAAACLLMLVILIKFLASLQLSSRRKPQKHDKFVICQVPCYTEGESSLRRTIDTLATLGYDDKHRLLFIICDGNIVGSGNDRPTPRIVLDILGVDPKLDPPPRSFRSIGEGGQQHNMAKVYSGLYEYEGHVVPYLVVAKIGKPTEKSRPGNRGKRDSQMLLLHFLSRVHFEAPMSPLDLEIYHQMKNVIGVHPSLYEYLLMVDADTEVVSDSLTRLVACMVHDAKVIGICGETQLTNEDFSWTTMIQVYEYFISHHMAKAFESLFGSVTCLPGCFCMYRLRTARGMPLIISKNVINDYSENHVDTLHKKNLLSLGEDRYLTTLMMKYFPQYKMTFTADAKCKTTAPDTWSVLLSQRRRWINSTVHNLVELVFLPEMCGFCCFSMRFVVFIDLFGTLTMPCTLFYLAYLAYLAISKIADIGYISLILIGAIYGLQAVIFVLKRQWQHIGWMIIYLLAYPLWSFFIPIYAFWHMDDFSWGNTRIVVGEDGKRQIFVKDEEPFDPDEIPMRTWAEYETDIFKRQQQVQEMEAVAQAIDEFGNADVRPVSRFTHIPGLDASQLALQQQQQQRMSIYSNGIADPQMFGMPAMQQQQQMYSPAGYSGYFGSMANGLPAPPAQPVATSSYNLMQVPAANQMPADETIVAAISSILDTADLSTVTMKQVRDELTRVFGIDMSARREFINQTVQNMIQRRS